MRTLALTTILPSVVTDFIQSVQYSFSVLVDYFTRLTEDFLSLYESVLFYVNVAYYYIDIIIPAPFRVTILILISSAVLIQFVGRD